MTVLGKVGEGDPPPPRTSICRGCAFLQEWGLLLLRDPPPQHMGTEPRVPPVVPPNKALTLNNAWGPHLLPMGGGKGGRLCPSHGALHPGGGRCVRCIPGIPEPGARWCAVLRFLPRINRVQNKQPLP